MTKEAITEDPSVLTYKLLTGEIVENHRGTFYFSEPGNWVDSDGYPITEKLHREDDPAIELYDGSKSWFLNGKLHRTDGPAIEHPDGTKAWCLNGKYHREDGPAIEYPDGSKHWCRNGKFHRKDGPAYEDADGSKEWFLNGIQLTEEEFNQQVKSK